MQPGNPSVPSLVFRASLGMALALASGPRMLLYSSHVALAATVAARYTVSQHGTRCRIVVYEFHHGTRRARNHGEM
jgi:hypothetical protein